MPLLRTIQQKGTITNLLKKYLSPEFWHPFRLESGKTGTQPHRPLAEGKGERERRSHINNQHIKCDMKNMGTGSKTTVTFAPALSPGLPSPLLQVYWWCQCLDLHKEAKFGRGTLWDSSFHPILLNNLRSKQTDLPMRNLIKCQHP